MTLGQIMANNWDHAAHCTKVSVRWHCFDRDEKRAQTLVLVTSWSPRVSNADTQIEAPTDNKENIHCY